MLELFETFQSLSLVSVISSVRWCEGPFPYMTEPELELDWNQNWNWNLEVGVGVQAITGMLPHNLTKAALANCLKPPFHPVRQEPLS